MRELTGESTTMADALHWLVMGKRREGNGKRGFYSRTPVVGSHGSDADLRLWPVK
jgi:hypothetical protein